MGRTAREIGKEGRMTDQRGRVGRRGTMEESDWNWYWGKLCGKGGDVRKRIAKYKAI